MFIEHLLNTKHGDTCFICISTFNITCIGFFFVDCMETLIPWLSLLSSNYEILDLSAKFHDKHYWSYFKLLPSCLSPKHFRRPPHLQFYRYGFHI